MSGTHWKYVKKDSGRGLNGDQLLLLLLLLLLTNELWNVWG